MTDKQINLKIKKHGYTPFVVKKEYPNYYQLDDGTILRVYPILNGVIMHPDNEGASVNVQNVVVAYVPKKLKGVPPSKLIPTDVAIKNIDVEDMDFDIISEHFNEYILDNKMIMKLKTNLSQVNRSKDLNQQGEPIYSVNTSVSPKFKKKK